MIRIGSGRGPRRVRCWLALAILVCGPACSLTPGTSTPVPGPQKITSRDTLVAALRQAGATVTPTGPASQPFLQATGQSFTVNQQPVEVYEYADAASAQTDAEQIAPNGNIPRTMVMWTGPPHFYRVNRILILYVGKDPGLLALLESQVGPPFATGPDVFAPPPATP